MSPAEAGLKGLEGLPTNEGTKTLVLRPWRDNVVGEQDRHARGTTLGAPALISPEPSTPIRRCRSV
jgi:hypothetical protein